MINDGDIVNLSLLLMFFFFFYNSSFVYYWCCCCCLLFIVVRSDAYRQVLLLLECVHVSISARYVLGFKMCVFCMRMSE